MIEIALKNINGKDVPAVTSLQVAESFEKEHKNVLRDIEAILPQVPEKFVKLNFELYEYPIETGIGTRMAKSYLLSKDAFTLLTMGYTGEKAMAFKVAYIARFNEMEKALQANAPTSLPEALRAYANMLEENELIRRQRDEAIRTKAWISDKKTATAMATASVAVRKAAALEDELGHKYVSEYVSKKALPDYHREGFFYPSINHPAKSPNRNTSTASAPNSPPHGVSCNCFGPGLTSRLACLFMALPSP